MKGQGTGGKFRSILTIGGDVEDKAPPSPLEPEGGMKRQGAGGKFRGILIIEGNVDDRTIIQRHRAHMFRVLRLLRAGPTTASPMRIHGGALIPACSHPCCEYKECATTQAAPRTQMR